MIAAELTETAGMWGDPAGAWQPPALAWIGRLAALGVPYDVRTSWDHDVRGLVIDPNNECARENSRVAGVVAGPPPATAEATLQLLAARLGAIVVPDLRHVLVLRLDDPGAAVKEHLRPWSHPPVDMRSWTALWETLVGFGRVSVFCCPGYVRPDGIVVESRAQLPAEWGALDQGVAAGVADLECHGFTHMNPDLSAWLAAPDRELDVSWYREMWPQRLAVEPSVAEQVGRLRSWQEGVGGRGTTVVAPGERWGLNTLAAAKDCGFALFNSWGLCFLDGPVPTWSLGIGSPYLDQPEPSWFADCLPQIGYWHDRDMAVHGPAWVEEQLSRWRDCGARRALSFADLAAAYGPIDAALVDGEVVVRAAPDAPLRVVRG